MRWQLKVRPHGLVALLALAVATLDGSAGLAQSNLPVAVQVDLLRDQIYAAAKANDSEAVLGSIDKYKQLGVALPVPLLWIEAKAAHDSGDAQRALNALGDFLAKTDRSSEQYKEALALYPKYQQDATLSESQIVDSRRQAMRTRIPEVVSQLEEDLVLIHGGDLQFRAPRFRVVNIRGGDPGARTAKISSFWLTKGEVPVLAWEVFAADTGRTYGKFEVPGKHDDLFEAVSDRDVIDFTSWLSAHSHLRWRLPSEAELMLLSQRLATCDEMAGCGKSKTPAEVGVGNYGNRITDVLPYLVRDCWHQSIANAPQDGTAWTTGCSDDRLEALAIWPDGHMAKGTDFFVFSTDTTWPLTVTVGRIADRGDSDRSSPGDSRVYLRLAADK